MVRQTWSDDSGRGRRLGRRLRQEARGGRPEFSAEFQARLMRRIEPLSWPKAAAEVRPSPVAAQTRGAATGMRSWTLAAAVAAVLAVVAVGPGTVRREGAPSGPARPMAPAVGASQPPGDTPPVAIETLPTFDEIEEGLRDGVKTLAASLVEVPDWASLADFDAAALLGEFPGP